MVVDSSLQTSVMTSNASPSVNGFFRCHILFLLPPHPQSLTSSMNSIFFSVGLYTFCYFSLYFFLIDLIKILIFLVFLCLFLRLYLMSLSNILHLGTKHGDWKSVTYTDLCTVSFVPFTRVSAVAGEG